MAHFNQTHGHSVGYKPTKEYRSWQAMRYRCHVPTNDRYRFYGARGIVVCQQWRESFEAFLSDMGPKPSPKHSIERIGNSQAHSPWYCRWATQLEQAQNTRATALLSCDGQTLSLSEWQRRTGTPSTTISKRLKSGWSVEDAIYRPSRLRKEKR